MAKKSKTQRAKASAARQQRKAARAQAQTSVELNDKTATLTEQDDTAQAKVFSVNKDVTTTAEEKPKRSAAKSLKAAVDKSAEKKEAAKAKAKKIKKRNRVSQFFHDVRAEMKRVTWPTRTDVLRWSGVVIVALLFFGIFTYVLDSWIVTPILFWISSF